MSESDFKERFSKSHDAVMLMARHFMLQGFDVTVSGVRCRPSREQWREFSDTGDLSIHTKIEVKQISAQFTGPHDWPFKDFIVCGKESFDRAEKRGQVPCRYYILNPQGTHYGMIHVAGTRARWHEGGRMDGRRGEMGEFYICAVSDVRWGAVNEKSIED